MIVVRKIFSKLRRCDPVLAFKFNRGTFQAGRLLRFMIEQPAFALHAAAVACEVTVGADEAMAGDDDTERVGRVGVADRARRLRPSNFSCEAGIGDRASGLDLPQRSPDLFLKGRAIKRYRDVLNRAKLPIEIDINCRHTAPRSLLV